MGWCGHLLRLLVLGCCCSFQCLVSGTEDFLAEISDLQCRSRDMRFSLPSMQKEFASAITVLGVGGRPQDLRNDSTCGFWVGQDLYGSMTIRAAYDGCYVREELGDHVMTLIMERIKNGQVEHHKKDMKCPFLPALDAPGPGDCADIQRTDRLQCANSSVPQDVCLQLGCCFSYGDQPQCYYGNKVTARCTDDGQVLIILSKDLTIPSLILESAYVVGVDSSSCSALTVSKTSAFLMFQFPLSCGAIIRDSANSVAYENTVQATKDIRTWRGSSITRDSTMRLTVRCRYYQSGYVPLQAEVLTLPPPLPVSTSGPLKLEMRMAKDDTYASYYMADEYPVTKLLRDLVYLEVCILQRTDPSLILMLDDCWATTTPDSTQQLQWPVLVNGCPFPGDNYKTIQVPVGSPSQSVPYPTHYQRFIISTFTFMDPNDQHSPSELVFFHCSAVVCVPSPTDSCSTLCGQRKKRDIQDSGKKITVSQGPVNFMKPSDGAQGDYWDYDLQNDTSDTEFIGAENTDHMDGGLIDINNFPRRVKDNDLDPDQSTMTWLWLRAVAVGGGVLAVTVAVLGVWQCHKSRSPTVYSVKI